MHKWLKINYKVCLPLGRSWCEGKRIYFRTKVITCIQNFKKAINIFEFILMYGLDIVRVSSCHLYWLPYTCTCGWCLLQVSKLEMSLEEMKSAASEIKLLRPVQEAIILFFKVETWEEAADEFGSEVLPEKLLHFAVSISPGYIEIHSVALINKIT